MNTGNNRTENEAVARGDDYLWDGSGEPVGSMANTARMPGCSDAAMMPTALP